MWRIVVGLSLIPAFGTLYQRLTLPESTRYISSQQFKHPDHAIDAGDNIEPETEKEPWDATIQKSAQNQANATEREVSDTGEVDNATPPPDLLVKKKAHLDGTFCEPI